MIDEVLFEKRLKDFIPEPLIDSNETANDFVETFLVQEDDKNIDLAKVNYLNFLNNDKLKKIAEDTIREYGIGTCGPRAFYGTTIFHEEFDQRLAEFLHMKDSLVYSYGFATLSTSIPAYCNPDDIIFVDEFVNFPIQQSLIASRSKIVKFSHNNFNDFKLKAQEFIKFTNTAKYLVLEGISWTTGKLCPLPDFLKVAEEFKIRVFLEESYTFGIFGKTGRGLLEYYNIDPNRVDMIFGTLETAAASIGGFAAAPVKNTIELQRMRGTGYGYSASLPTYLVKTVMKTLEMFESRNDTFLKLTKKVHWFLKNDCKFNVISDPQAPFKLIRIDPKTIESKVFEFCKRKGVHFIHNENGLIINLNINLLDEDEKRLKIVFKVFKEAADYKLNLETIS